MGVNSEKDQLELQKLKKGDREAFAYIFEKYHSDLFLFCFRILKTKAVSDDVVQDVFVKIWESRESIDLDQFFPAYLYQIARNKIIDLFRKTVHKEKYLEMVYAEMQYSKNHTEEEVIYHDYTEKIDTIVKTLPTQRQRIYKLSREEGLSYSEISEELGISVNTVKVSISKSLKFIRQQILTLKSLFL